MPQNNQMHPDDKRNMYIFAIVAIVLYGAYSFFVMEPQKANLKQAKAAQAQMFAAEIQKQKETGEDPTQIMERKDALSKSTRIKFENDKFFGSIALKGGRIDDVGLHDYFETLEKEKKVRIFAPAGTDYPRYADYGWISSDKSIAVPDKDTRWSAQSRGTITPEQGVDLVWNSPQGLRFKRNIQIDEEYGFQITQSVTNKSGREVTLYPYSIVSQTGLPKNLQATYILHEGPMGYIGEDLFELSYKSLKKDNQVKAQSNNGWIGITDKYWLAAIVPAQNSPSEYRFTHIPKPDILKKNLETGKTKKVERSVYQVDVMGAGVALASGETVSHASHLYAGAKVVSTLEAYQDALNIPNFDLAVDFGILWFMTKPFYHIVHFFGELFGNFGFAILMLTLVIRTAVFPLTNMSYVSFAKMKKVAPQITEIRKKYEDDKQELQKQIMGLYQREGVNPMSGCLPILLQIPIFFALYKTLFVTIEMRHAPFFGWIQDLSVKDPTSIFNIFGLLPYGVPDFLQIGVWPCLMLVVMIVQKQLNPPPTDPIQRDMMKFFPFVITFVLAKFAAGLVIYWAFSAFLGVLQQMLIMRRLNVPIHLFGESEDEEEAGEDKADEKPDADVEEAQAPAKKISKPKPKKSKKKKK
jgi:YidC/Oxa1 family membrane protein insertase